MDGHLVPEPLRVPIRSSSFCIQVAGGSCRRSQRASFHYTIRRKYAGQPAAEASSNSPEKFTGAAEPGSGELILQFDADPLSENASEPTISDSGELHSLE